MSSLSIGSKGAPTSLKSCQLAAVTNFLSSTSDNDASKKAESNPYGGPPTTTANSSSSPWKLLIYDTHCRSIISPLLSVSRLRSLGVTLHLLLPSDREPIPDVPAVYFVQPTRENLAIVARDCSRNLYQCAHLHFSSRIERPIMEDFARLVVNTGGLQQVASVHDQFVDFCCHEENLFTLNVKESYVVYNNPGAGESEMEGAMERIAGGLFSVVVTLGCVPVIRCPRVSCLLEFSSIHFVCFELHHSFESKSYRLTLSAGRSTRNGGTQTEQTNRSTPNPPPIQRSPNITPSTRSRNHGS